MIFDLEKEWAFNLKLSDLIFNLEKEGDFNLKLQIWFLI